MVKLAGKFVKSVMPGVIKPIHVLWNEMIGFIFLVFAIVGWFNGYRYFRLIETEPDALGRFALTAIFASVMTYFAVSSFRRARKISKT
ncbi:hypothetical protein F183_A10770 [Bryobacterales bacterium F-183]|nr:hypothetical protein F183_A10770 [Bryobacterales bacterium F-183]